MINLFYGSDQMPGVVVAAATYLIVDEPTTLFSLLNLYYTAATIWFMDSLIAFVV